MDYIRIESIRDPLFEQMHALMGTIFPPEEVLAFPAWEEPLKDQGLRVYVAVHEGKVVGATEYRYYPDMQVAMTDFTIIGQEGLGIGPYLVKHRSRDLAEWVKRTKGPMIGMFAEIYNPYAANDCDFGGVKPMNPVVRREVLSHLGYLRLDFSYIHPSWQENGDAVSGLDLCFMPASEDIKSLSGSLVAEFLRTYYAPLEPKPAAWHAMVEELQSRSEIALLPL